MSSRSDLKPHDRVSLTREAPYVRMLISERLRVECTDDKDGGKYDASGRHQSTTDEAHQAYISHCTLSEAFSNDTVQLRHKSSLAACQVNGQ